MVYTDYITSHTRVDVESREGQVIHLLKLFIKHNQLVHTQNLKFMDDIVSLWMKMCDKFQKIFLE